MVEEEGGRRERRGKERAESVAINLKQAISNLIQTSF